MRSFFFTFAPILLSAGFVLPLIDRLVFFPDREMPPTPPGFEDRRVTTSDGVELHGWYARAATPDAPTLLWAHGNGGNIGGRSEVQRALVANGLNVFAYDYRGYGHSSGAPTEEGVYRDALAAYDALVASGVEPSSIVCFGESLGGAVTLALAEQRRCAGVAIVSTFTTIADVARAHYGPLGWLATGRFDSASRVRSLDAPLFVAHGDRDEIVPYGLGIDLFSMAPEPKEFLRVDGAGHNDIFAHPRILEALAGFSRWAVELARSPVGP